MSPTTFFNPEIPKSNSTAHCVSSLGQFSKELAKQKGSIIHEGHLMPDHVHILVQIPPKFSVFSVVGYIKGKSAI